MIRKAGATEHPLLAFAATGAFQSHAGAAIRGERSLDLLLGKASGLLSIGFVARWPQPSWRSLRPGVWDLPRCTGFSDLPWEQ